MKTEASKCEDLLLKDESEKNDSTSRVSEAREVETP